MHSMEIKIKRYFEGMNPKILGVKKVVITSIKKLGIGESNLNYIVETLERKFVFRLHIEHNTINKPKWEFIILKSIEKLNVAPKPFLYELKNKMFRSSFIILEYVEGKALPNDYQLSDEQLKILAKELTILHLYKITKKIPPNKLSFKGYLTRFKQDIRYINKKISENKLGNSFSETLLNIKNILIKEVRKNEEKNVSCITHGDIAPQNIIEVPSGFKFIDWESAGIGDPAAEVAFVIDGIGFPISETQKKAFLNEYLKHRCDSTLQQRINLFIKLIRFEQVLWSIKRIYEINDKELSIEYLAKENKFEIVSYLNWSIEKLLKLELDCNKMDFNGKKIFPSNLKI